MCLFYVFFYCVCVCLFVCRGFGYVCAFPYLSLCVTLSIYAYNNFVRLCVSSQAKKNEYPIYRHKHNDFGYYHRHQKCPYFAFFPDTEHVPTLYPWDVVLPSAWYRWSCFYIEMLCLRICKSGSSFISRYFCFSLSFFFFSFSFFCVRIFSRILGCRCYLSSFILICVIWFIVTALMKWFLYKEYGTNE